MTVQPVFVGTTPALTDVLLDDDGGAIDLTGATVTLMARPVDSATPLLSMTATPDADQVTNRGRVMLVLGSPIMDAPLDYSCWWHAVLGNGTILDTGNFLLPVVTHGPGAGEGSIPYLTASLFLRLTRVKQSRLGLSSTNPNANEFLQVELDRAAVYIEFVTGQPATDSTQPVLPTASGTYSTTSMATLIRQVIQMRAEQTLFQSQHGYLDDATDDVVTSLSVGSFSQSKSDSARRGEQKQLNSWQALSNLLWMLMTPGQFGYWEALLSSDPTLAIGPMYTYENVIQAPYDGPSYGFGFGGYGFGAADLALANIYGGGWGRPTDVLPLLVD